MKKKILSIALVLCLLAVAVVGTLAYFNDTDAQKNTFTTGNVAIDLWEDFGDNDAEGIEHLVPATGSAQDGTLENGIEKEVYVTNVGSEDAYVRVHIAIPTILDDGDPSFNASKNTLHFNYDDENVVDGKWNWSNSVDTATGDNWNYYETSIDNVSYNVYVVTYESVLEAGSVPEEGDVTESAIHQVYLDSKTTNANIEGIVNAIGPNWYIYVAAEGTQAEGFEDAYEALNTAFGDPADAAYTSKIDWKTVSGKVFENKD